VNCNAKVSERLTCEKSGIALVTRAQAMARKPEETLNSIFRKGVWKSNVATQKDNVNVDK